MRSERKEKKRLKKDKRAGKVSKFIAGIYILAAVCFAALLMWIDVIPTKYWWVAIGIIGLISILIVCAIFSKKSSKAKSVVATVFAVIFIGLFGAGAYYLNATISFLEEITEIGETKEDFYLIVKAASKYENVEDLDGETIGAYADTDATYAQARNQLRGEIDVEYDYTESLPDLLDNLIQGKDKAVFLSAASYSTMKDLDLNLEEETRIIYTCSIVVERESLTTHVNVTEEAFNILVSGLDITGNINNVSRSDVNMIITVNPTTKEILLTSIPRDYYVELPSKNSMDKLTHSGLYGIQETVAAVEEFMGVDINYYVKVNYSTITDLVDAMGGIEIDSPYSFTTHGMGVYYQFNKGYNYLDGAKALAYCRERQSWADGDMRRNENQQLILEAIIKKALGSTTILSDYATILNSIKDTIETDMSKSDMTSLIKMQLSDMSSWTIEKQALKGESASRMCYSVGTYASVILQNEVMVAESLDKIIEIQQKQ
jgi:LCP family protein required for cell wall assembly